MPRCQNCGELVDSDARFCTECGARILRGGAASVSSLMDDYQDDLVFDKCPECGEPIPPFATRCPSCGMEFQGRNSVIMLSRMLDEIESTRPREDRPKRKLFTSKSEIEYVTPTDNRKATLIQSYPIPNTKEDLIEFVVLASANISPRDLSEEMPTTGSGRAISSAWYSKMQQAQAKAVVALADDDKALKAVLKRCEKTEKAISKARRRGYSIIVAAIVFMIVLVAVPLTMQFREEAYRASLSPTEQIEFDINKAEEDLKDDVAAIKWDIEDSHYEDARNKIYALEFDEGLSKERHDYWEKRKKGLLKMVNDAENRKE